MDTTERDELIAKLIGEGLSLSDVQKVLEREHNLKITYMELRLIASDLKVDWSKQDKTEDKPQPTDDLNAAVEDDEPGTTRVSVSKVVRPGALMSGDVTFKSGGRAEWSIDQMGRLALNPVEGTAKPDQDDLVEFQQELQRIVSSQMGG